MQPLTPSALQCVLALRLQWRGRSAASLALELTGPAAAEALAASRQWAPSAEVWRAAARQAVSASALDIAVVPVWSVPERLLRCGPSPLCLFVRGDAGLLRAPAVSVVGSRKASPSALQWAERQAASAAVSGWLVVSGGARGIDAAAHRSAMAAGGRTLVYMGSAADSFYPASHKALFLQILKRGGAVVSEHAPGEKTFPSAHATRNRFIASHADKLLIAEAAEASGTLGAATYGRRAGVHIWVSPPGVGLARGGLDDIVNKGWGQVLVDDVGIHTVVGRSGGAGA